MLIKKKQCYFCQKKEEEISYDHPDLKKFISEKGKITPARYTGTCAKHQRKLKQAIKLARNIGLLSFTNR
ncbi:MAG: 30S ribosomal protein S18 [candidate division WOR-3 bacterium]|nr:30S ribosomal protein S18 [candidate division WOR-3 bacterium]